MTDYSQKPMTHTAWTPLFDDDGNFVRYVEIGEGILQTEGDGAVIMQSFKDRQAIGFDSVYFYLVPHGKKPPAPPTEILESARFYADEQKNLAITH